MPKSGIKGTIAAVVAAGAMILIIFTFNISLSGENNNETFTKIQLARDNSLKTENIIRLLDKATADGYYDRLDISCNSSDSSLVNSYFTQVISNTTQGSVGKETFKCTFTSGPSFNAPNLTASGTLECTSKIGDFTTKHRRFFSFDKTAVSSGGACTIIDAISGCMEQPTFSCP
ncbi:MAG TPA: hypothetical protein VJG83_06140 [archaeon]|nr:hypothetical protein [archaeon]